jgi:hypothetical protein
MRNISPQRFGMMGKLYNYIGTGIDASQLNHAEILTVLEMQLAVIRNLLMARAEASRSQHGSNVEKTSV